MEEAFPQQSHPTTTGMSSPFPPRSLDGEIPQQHPSILHRFAYTATAASIWQGPIFLQVYSLKAYLTLLPPEFAKLSLKLPLPQTGQAYWTAKMHILAANVYWTKEIGVAENTKHHSTDDLGLSFIYRDGWKLRIFELLGKTWSALLVPLLV